MPKLSGSQRKWLRGQAHALRPIVRLGKQGLTDGALREVDAALDAHELIKVQANDKAETREAAGRFEQDLRAEAVGLIGHVVILYRRQPDPEKRKIELP